MLKNRVAKTVSLFTHSTSLLLAAIIVGSIVGLMSPKMGSVAGNYIDPTILALVVLLLFEVPIKGIFKGGANIRFISLAWILNFMVIPLIGFGIASLFLSGKPLFYTGLVIYFMAPCTDWYLGFTRLAKGNVELGATLLPINMISQLVLFPVYLLAFNTVIEYKIDLSVLMDWFIQPLIAAAVLRFCLHRFIDRILPLCSALIPLVLMLLVGQIFAANINELAAHLSIVPLLLFAIFVFFIVTFAVGELVAKVAKLAFPEHCLLTFTTGARNAPLMLGLTTVAMPDQPLIYATITIGMLIEFPHLTALKAIFLRRYKASESAPSLVNREA
ncbi:arsenic resistance protein [Thaumasiovibrio subtropicus]|uniref:arsenic resistance protein n=1 Tax=Thaumasiovibrio subtropicus TaxID=1891207 RepID=UPI00192D1BD3|nr:arsenic resistance protein [Thaumasiovibrio subtropicus]